MYVIKIIFLCMLTSCTLSLSNISTEGKASDVIDEDMKADADISPDVNIPAV